MKTIAPTQNFISIAQKASSILKDLGHGDILTNGYEFENKDSVFTIQILDRITDDLRGVPLKTGARIGHTSKTIQLDKTILTTNEKYTPDFIFFLIIWCYYILHTKELEEYSETEKYCLADKLALNVSVKNGKSKKQILIGLTELLSHALNDMNTQRLKNISNFILNEKVA